jgi:site-specific DNA recombinase
MQQNINLNRQRAAIYVRVSSSKQSEEKTIDSQLEALKDYAEKHNFDVPEGWIFKDDGISGSTIQRPALDNLRDLVSSGSPDILLIYHPDRLARKYVYQALLLDEFSKYGIEVIFYKNKKAVTPEEHLLEQFQGVFAEYERAQITERCRRGKLHKARQGSVTVLPNAPFGYRYIKSDGKGSRAHYQLDQEESQIIQKLFQMYGVEGKKISELTSYMNQSIHKPRKSSCGWDKSTIRKMLHNRAYIGMAGYSKTEKCEGDSQRILRAPKSGRMQISKSARKKSPEEQWITIQIPAIITEGIYRIVQEKLNEARHFASRNTRKPSILQGVLVCGKCGASFYKKSRKNKKGYYSCHRALNSKSESCGNRSIQQDHLDGYMWNWIISILKNPNLIEVEITRRAAEDPDRKRLNERKMDLKRTHNKLINARNKLLDAYTEGECLSLEELKKRMIVLNQQIQQTEKETAVIETQTADEERIKQSRLTLTKFSESLENSSIELSIEEKQRVVRALIHEVIIFEDSIKIRHCIPISNDENLGIEKCPLTLQRSEA